MSELPHSQESEMMVLGCMLTSINCLNIAANTLDDSDFYFTEHKIIFQTMKAAYKNDQPADIHLIGEELKRQEKLKVVGGINYLTTLAQYAGTSVYIEEYVEILRKKSKLRLLVSLIDACRNRALEDSENPTDLISETMEKLEKIEKHQNGKERFSIRFLDEFNQNYLLVEPPKKQCY